MGYACPVCGDPQSDAEHLANHLAFTAMLGNDDHEAWLDEHAPDWQAADATALAETVTELAEDAEFPQVFEDTVDRRETGGGSRSSDATGDHDHDHGRDPASERSGALFDDEPQFAADARDRAERDRDLDDQAERILQEAQEMTERMLDDDTDDADGDEAETE